MNDELRRGLATLTAQTPDKAGRPGARRAVYAFARFKSLTAWAAGFALIATCGACDSSGQSAAGGGAVNQGGASGNGSAAMQPVPTLTPTNRYQGVVTGLVTTGGQGGSSGAGPSNGGAAGGLGGAAGTDVLQCVFEAPSGAPRGVCGDGFLSPGEQCDDGNVANGDACSSTCVVTPTLVAPHVGTAGSLPFPGRTLGRGAHPSAVGCNTVGVSFVDQATKPAALRLALFSSVGQPRGVLDFGAASLDSPDPSLAALPDDSFVATWTAFDSDELGIRVLKVDGQQPTPANARFANVEQAFSQRAPDIVFDGAQLIVAWVDDSDPVNGPDLRYRTFDADLEPTSDELTLSATSAVEDHVTLAGFKGRWAAAWRSGRAGSETIEVQSGSSHWSVGPFLAGASDDRPALTFVDSNHLALAFTAGTDPFASGVAAVPRLHAAVLDTGYPGHTESFQVKPLLEPYASLLGVSQTQPSVVSFADRLAVAWRSSSAPGGLAGDELWSREIKWSTGPDNTIIIDTTAAEHALIGSGALRAGDQARPVMLSSDKWPDHRLFSVWEDASRGFGQASGTPDVALQFSQVPGELPTDPSGPCSALTLSISPAQPALEFRSLTLTAVATCGGISEAEYQFGYQNPTGTSLTMIRSWGSATANWNTAGLPSGNYSVYAYARRKGSTANFEVNAGTSYLVGNVCYKDPTFSITPSGVQPIGTQLSLSAAATCAGSGTVAEQSAYYQLPGSASWTAIGSWSAGPVAWDTTGLPSGAYTLFTYIRARGNTSGEESYAYGSALLGDVCYAVNSISGLPASPQGVGATIALSGSASCVGATTPEFLYYYYPLGSGSAVQIGNWSSGPVNWVTTGLPPGNYTLLAYARGAGNLGRDSQGYGSFQLGNPCPSVSLSAAPSSVQPVGTSVTLTAIAGCMSAEYRFSYRLWGTAQWLPLTDWSTSPTTVWNTSGLMSGNYEQRVDARVAGHGGQETTTEINYLLGSVCPTAGLSVSPASPSAVGTTVALSGSATCVNGAEPEYQFYYRAPGAAQQVMIRDWGPAVASWSTGSLAPGAYSVYAYARARGNAEAYDSPSEESYVLQ